MAWKLVSSNKNPPLLREIKELGVPCVIGTKIATKVLKDGDKVEVDAEKGVVKKL